MTTGDWRARARTLAFDRGGLLAVVIAIAYLALAPSRIVDGEGAEFSTLGVTGGIGHPSGYPLYVLWLRAWSWLPGTPAHAAAFATVILAVAHVVVLHAACRAWGARPIAATIAVAVYAGSPIVLRIYTEPEVFALNGLAIAAVLWLAAAGRPVRGGRRVVLLGLAAGLGLANHTSCGLVLPVGIAGAIRGLREVEGGRRRIAIAAAGVGGLAVGLAPYLYLFVAPRGGLSWGSVDTAGDLVRHFLRADYGGLGAFAAHGAAVPVADNLGALAMTLGRAWWWALLAFGLGALGYRVVRGADRAQWACLAVAFVIAGPVLVARFNIAPVGLGGAVVERFHLVALELLVIPVAVGLDRVLAWFTGRTGVAIRPGLAHALAALVFAGAAAGSLARLAVAHSDIPERTVRNLLASMPPDAVVIGSSDFLYDGTAYLQTVVGLRPDVTYIERNMLSYPWYRATLERRLGGPLVPAGPEPRTVRVARGLLARGKAVFVDFDLFDVLLSQPSYPYGLVVRVLPDGARPPPLADVVAQNRAVFDRFDLAYKLPGRDDDWAGTLQRGYAETWRILADALDRAGQPDAAAEARARQAALAPY